jgi:hypothetical protein
MRWLRSVRVRLVLAVFATCAPFFATNVVREHYPALALARGDGLRCDEFVVERADPGAAGGVRAEPLISDLFRHADGHWYANNQVGASLVAAPVLLLSRPLLAPLEAAGRRQAEEAAKRGETPRLDTPYARRAQFFADVFARGWHLLLPAAAALTAVLVMAPAAALLALLFHDELLRRGARPGRALALALLLPVVTPLLFRSAILNHNQLVALLTFAAFVVLRPGAGAGGSAASAASIGASRLCLGGALAGGTLLFDYSGVVVATAFGLAALIDGARAGGGREAVRRGALLLAGALPPGILLLATQQAQFGDPFKPAQHWMPDAHWSVEGYRGIAWPDLALLGRNLFDPSFGLFAFAPLLLLALWPASRRVEEGGAADTAPKAAATPRIVPAIAPGERRFVLLFAAGFALFCAMNRFTDLQWNTGFRCLAPVAPLLMVLAAAPLSRLGPRALAWVVAPFALHSLVLAMFRFTSPLRPESFTESTIARSWGALLERGLQLPWLTAWRQSQGGGPAWSGFAASALLLLLAAVSVALWRSGARALALAAPAEPAR